MHNFLFGDYLIISSNLQFKCMFLWLMTGLRNLSCLTPQFFKDKGIKVVTVYPPATFTPMTVDRDDMEPVPEKEAQPSDIAKAAMLVMYHSCILVSTYLVALFFCAFIPSV